MTKAVLLPITCILLVTASAAPAQTTSSSSDASAAVNEAVMRQADVIVLRQKLDAANSAVQQKDFTAAAKLYQDAYNLVQTIGPGIQQEASQTVSGLVSV